MSPQPGKMALGT